MRKLSFLTVSLNHFRSNVTPGQNKKYHLLFVWPSPAITKKKKNVSIWYTKEDKWFLVTLPSFAMEFVFYLSTCTYWEYPCIYSK
jgi:hypothetical protein